MFDVGFWEILLILVLALVIIGPERLPGAARQAGYFVRKARRYIEGVRSEVESELDIGEFKRMLHNQEVQINELQQQLKSGINDVKSDLPSSDFLTEVPSPSFHDEEPVQLNDTKPNEKMPDQKVTVDKPTAGREKTSKPDELQSSSAAKKERP
jgi:sec-independent protein translocase protein TatB